MILAQFLNYSCRMKCKYKNIGFAFFLIFLLAYIFTNYVKNRPAPKSLFQYSVLGSLMTGVYDGALTVGELKQKGDFGIGTLNGLDGEMLALNGAYYQVKSDGKIYVVGDAQKVPFATVSFFTADKSMELAKGLTFMDLPKQIEPILPSTNLFYAVKIEGVFAHIQTRSIEKQEKPFQPLAKVAKTQSLFEANNIEGTMVGFWCPHYVSGLNVAGFHLHFIAKDKSMGGHVLNFAVDKAKLEYAVYNDISLTLPKDDDFLKSNISGIKTMEINAVENKSNND